MALALRFIPSAGRDKASADDRAKGPWSMESSDLFGFFDPVYCVAYGDWAVSPSLLHERAQAIMSQINANTGPFALRDDMDWAGVDDAAIAKFGKLSGPHQDPRFKQIGGPFGSTVKGFFCMMCIANPDLPLVEALNPQVHADRPAFVHAVVCARVVMRDLKRAMDANTHHFLLNDAGSIMCAAPGCPELFDSRSQLLNHHTARHGQHYKARPSTTKGRSAAITIMWEDDVEVDKWAEGHDSTLAPAKGKKRTELAASSVTPAAQNKKGKGKSKEVDTVAGRRAQ